MRLSKRVGEETIVFIRSSDIYNDSRATKEIRTILEHGYRVIVLGWNRNGDAKNKTKQVFEKYADSIELRFFDYDASEGIGVKNIHVMIKWLNWIKRNIKKHGTIEYVHACNLDCVLSIIKYCNRKRIKLVYDIYDYYPDSHNMSGVLKNMAKWMEGKVINMSDAVIVCTEERKNQIYNARPKRLYVIYNSPRIDFSESEIKYDYVYCGTLGGNRLIREIIEGYEKNKDLKIAVAGYGKYSNLAKQFSIKYKNFDFFGTLTYSDVLMLESESLVLSAIYKPTIRNHRYCAPNKFYEAMALSKPIIVCKGTGIDRAVAENNTGMVIDYDVKQFYDSVRAIKADKNKAIRMGKKSHKLYNNEYSWSIMEERLISIYKEIK